MIGADGAAKHILDTDTCNKLLTLNVAATWQNYLPNYFPRFYPLFDENGELHDFTQRQVPAPFVLELDSWFEITAQAMIIEQYPAYQVYRKYYRMPIKGRRIPILKHLDGSYQEHPELASTSEILLWLSDTNVSATWKWAPCQYEERNRFFEWIVDHGFLHIQFTIHIPDQKTPSSGPFKDDPKVADPKYDHGGTKDFLPDDYIKMTGVYAMKDGDEAYLLGKDHKWHLVQLGDTLSGDFLKLLFGSGYFTQPIDSSHQYTLLQMDAWEKLRDIVDGKLMRVDVWVQK